jgi:hypothetical protein
MVCALIGQERGAPTLCGTARSLCGVTLRSRLPSQPLSLVTRRPQCSLYERLAVMRRNEKRIGPNPNICPSNSLSSCSTSHGGKQQAESEKPIARKRCKNAFSHLIQAAEVVADRGEDGVVGIAVASGEIVAVHSVLFKLNKVDLLT